MDKARRSRGVRLVTLLAASVTFASAFGLHPEPATGRTALASSGIGLPGSRVADSVPHDCLACRAHRPLVVASTPAAAPNVRGSLNLAPPASTSPPISFEPASFDGRAPPSVS